MVRARARAKGGKLGLRALLVVALAAVGGVAQGQGVSLTEVEQAGRTVLRLENYRVELTIDPARGGAVTAYSDKLAPAELIPPQQYMGLCMDHFQEQNWPGEFLEVPYEWEVVSRTAEEAQVRVWRTATGVWREKLPNEKLAGVLLEKTYTLRADSPALTSTVRLTAPEGEAKVFAYWMQHVFFAGGDYDPATDRTFRPSARGVRNTGREGNGHWGTEEWLRDFADGWMALLDTEKQTGLVSLTRYDDLSIVYANGGNVTNELMFNTTYQPAGTSREYTVQVTPVVGLERVLYAGPEVVLGYDIETDNQGGGKLNFEAVRSAEAVEGVRLEVVVVNAMQPEEQKAVGEVEFGALGDEPQSGGLTWSGGPPDPVVIRVAISGRTAAGEEFSRSGEDFFPGAYKWADNIQTDMRTPVYQGERPAQELTLNKPERIVWRKPYHARWLLFQGLLDEEYQVGPAMRLTGYAQEADIIHYSWSGSWYGALSDFPYDYEKLLGYGGVILGGVSRSALKPIGVEMLHDYVTAGGGLVVLGSHGAYGRSRLAGTALGEALPVEFADNVFSLRPTGGQRVVYGPEEEEFLRAPRLGEQATCWYVHEAEVKPGARVLMRVGEKPFLVAGEYGPNRARVLCLLGAPMGRPGARQTAFWRDPAWYLILRNALWWVARADERFEE